MTSRVQRDFYRDRRRARHYRQFHERSTRYYNKKPLDATLGQWSGFVSFQELALEPPIKFFRYELNTS